MSKFERVEKYRVAVYSSERLTGLACELTDSGLLGVQLDDDRYLYFHPKQCRRLVKKPRRRVWVNFRHADAVGEYPYEVHLMKTRPDMIEFREVVRKRMGKE